MSGKHFSSSSIEKKGHNDLVSYVDKTAERKLVEGLSKLLPGSGFITEEKTVNITGETYNWIIDPLDGTTNFVHGIRCFCISVALMKPPHPPKGGVKPRGLPKHMPLIHLNLHSSVSPPQGAGGLLFLALYMKLTSMNVFTHGKAAEHFLTEKKSPFPIRHL